LKQKEPHALPQGRSDFQMPILRYFVYVGGALLALVLVVNLVLPGPAGVESTAVVSNTDLPLIRIRSDRKLPERVVLDTS